MDIRGKYFPVGKGLTYGFKIDEYHILFDIAKMKKTSNLPNDIENFFGNKRINILTLSHFHDDHIGGVKRLLDEGFEFQKIFIPYYDSEELIIVNLAYIYSKIKLRRSSASSMYDYKIQNDLSRYQDIDLSEISLFEYDLEELLNSNNNETTIEKINDSKIVTKEFWDFCYMNSECSERYKIERFFTELKAEGIYSKADLNSMLISKYQEIKEIYKLVFTDYNATSMFLIHGPKDSNLLKNTKFHGKCYIKNPLFYFDAENNYYSLITSDCYLKRNHKKIIAHVDKLKYVLVPHHSSIKSWDNLLCKISKDIVWIVTISNIGIRPYATVVKDIYDNDQELYICDKIEPFEYQFNMK